MSEILLEELKGLKENEIVEYVMGFGKLKLDILAYRLGIKNRAKKRKLELAEEIAAVYCGKQNPRASSAVRKK